MEKHKAIMSAYRDGLYSERETLYRIVELDAPNQAIKDALFAWLDGKVQGKATLRAIEKAMS